MLNFLAAASERADAFGHHFLTNTVTGDHCDSVAHGLMLSTAMGTCQQSSGCRFQCRLIGCCV